MLFMLFMLFGAFNVVVQRPHHPGDHIDCIISRRPPIHGTWHIRSAASSGTAAIAPASASLSFAPSSMTTKPIQFNHCCACSGVFAVLFVVDDNEADTNSFMLRLRRRLCPSFLRWWKRRYEFIHVAPVAATLSFTPSLMTTKPIRFNHVDNQHSLPFIRLLQSGDQPRLLSIAWL